MRVLINFLLIGVILGCSEIEQFHPSQVLELPVDSIQYNYNKQFNINYSDLNLKDDCYQKSNCLLDIYYPIGKPLFSTIIWVHGGGLTSGNKFLPEKFLNRGIAIVSIDYRLSPDVKCPVYIEDVASAITWVYRNIGKYGGATDKIYLVGYSAGAYLSMIVSLNSKWLSKYNIKTNTLAGVFSISGQLTTHSTILDEKGYSKGTIIVDEYAPIYYDTPDVSKIFLYTGGREKEIPSRFAENFFFYQKMISNGFSSINYIEFRDYTHETVLDVALPYVVKAIKDDELN